MSLIVSTSGGFWPLLLAETKRHDIDLLFSWPFPPVIGCLSKVLLLTDGIQQSVLMALVITVTEPNIQI